MPIKFNPHYTITSKIANCLVRIGVVKQQVLTLPLVPTVLSSLRESARLYTTHYSTMIEGNRLDADQIEQVLKHDGHFPGKERDELEVKGYYAALNQVEKWTALGQHVNEKIIKTLHALVIANGRLKVKPTPYRDGQNVIRNSRTKAIVYLPPEAKDVPDLMNAMIEWIKESNELPCPIVAGLVHYQFATIHPYYDGNGRTARLLTTMILHLGDYDLKGLYSLEEYYAQNLNAYYSAISVGDSHNYYMGRAEADLTGWIEYFIEGMANSFEKVLQQMQKAASVGHADQSNQIRALDPKQRKALELFEMFDVVTGSQIGALFGFKSRTSAKLCADWVSADFLKVLDSSRKGRKYGLSSKYEKLVNKLDNKK